MNEPGGTPAEARGPSFGTEGVCIDPPPDAWEGLVAASWGRTSGDAACIRARSESGLDTDGPVIASGHQPVFWHPGILAKWFAVEAAGDWTGGRRAWVVVDHDLDDPAVVTYPRVTAAGLERLTWTWLDRSEAGTPPSRSPPGPPMSAPGVGGGMLDSVADGLRSARAALDEYASSPTLSEQVTRATARMIGGPAPVFLSSSSLLGMSCFDDVVEAMRADAAGCARAYNAAVVAHPEGGLSPLSMDGGRIELPIWNLASGGERRRVYADSLDDIPRSCLAPRAILLTALMRMRLCDVFVHGLGGGIYDRACDAWIERWKPEWRLAPTTVVTATLRLEGLASAAEASQKMARRAVWLAHHARHNPGSLGESALQAKKMELVNAVRIAPARSSERIAAFDRLRAFVVAAQRAHTESLDRLDAAARVSRGGEAADVVAKARDWPFFLYPAASLAGLRAQVRAAFGAR